MTSEFNRKINKNIFLSFHLCSETHPRFSSRFKILCEGHLSAPVMAHSEICVIWSPSKQFNEQAGMPLFYHSILPPNFLNWNSMSVRQGIFQKIKNKKGKLKKASYQPIWFHNRRCDLIPNINLVFR